MPGPHQIATEVLPRPDEIARRFLLGSGHPDRVQPADHQQPHETLGVAGVGLDPVLSRTLDLPRRGEHTLDPRRSQRSGQPQPGRPRLIGDPTGRGSPEQNMTTSSVSPGSRYTVISPDSLSTTHATALEACTSRPAQLRTFAMVGTPSIRMVLWSTAEAITLGASHPPHATRTEGCRPTFDTRLAVPPYGLTFNRYPTNGARR